MRTELLRFNIVNIMVADALAPGVARHQCPWYWLCRIGRCFSYRREDFSHLCHVDIFKCIFLNENVWISIKISLKFVPKGPINNIPSLVQIMAWRCPGNKPLSEAMMVYLPTHICVTRPQWVKVQMPPFNKMHVKYLFAGSLSSSSEAK